MERMRLSSMEFTCGTSVPCITSGKNYNVRLCVYMFCNAVNKRVNKRRNNFYKSSLSSKLKENMIIKLIYCIFKLQNWSPKNELLSYRCYNTFQCIHLDSHPNRPHQHDHIFHCSYNTHCRGVRPRYHSIPVCILFEYT